MANTPSHKNTHEQLKCSSLYRHLIWPWLIRSKFAYPADFSIKRSQWHSLGFILTENTHDPQAFHLRGKVIIFIATSQYLMRLLFEAQLHLHFSKVYGYIISFSFLGLCWYEADSETDRCPNYKTQEVSNCINSLITDSIDSIQYLCYGGKAIMLSVLVLSNLKGWEKPERSESRLNTHKGIYCGINDCNDVQIFRGY